MKYFWNYEYRHEMRGLKPSIQKEVYDVWLEFGLELDGKSQLHIDLMNEMIGDYTIQGEPKGARQERLENAYNF